MFEYFYESECKCGIKKFSYGKNKNEIDVSNQNCKWCGEKIKVKKVEKKDLLTNKITEIVKNGVENGII